MTTLNDGSVAARRRALASTESNGRFQPVNEMHERPHG